MANILQRIMGTDDAAQAGHNNPPSDMEILQERISENNKTLLEGVETLLQEAREMPRVIESDDQAGVFTDKIKQITGSIKSLESTRVAEKEPYLALTRAVDGFFKVPAGKLEAAKIWITQPLDVYLKKKETEARVAREAEAKRLREQSERELQEAAELAKTSPKAADIGVVNAHVTQQRSEHVEASIAAAPASMASSRGTSGGLAGLRTRWVGVIKDRQGLDLNALRPYFSEDSLQKALNAAVTAGIRTIGGADIIQKTDTVVR